MIKTVKYVFLTAMILSLLTGCRKKAADSGDTTEKDPGQATKQVKPDTPPVDEQETVKTEPVADDKTEQIVQGLVAGQLLQQIGGFGQFVVKCVLGLDIGQMTVG